MPKSAFIEDQQRLHFYFFDKPQIRRWGRIWKDLSIVAKKPELLDVERAVTTRGSGDGTRISGVYDRDNKLVGPSVRTRGKERRPDGEPGHDELKHAPDDRRDAYYLGPGSSHYGHFILETLCRAWAWREHGANRVAVLQTAVPRFARDLYALIPGLLVRLEVISTPTRFHRMLVPGPGFVLARTAHVEFKQLCERMAEQIVARPGPLTEQPLYLSRAGLNAENRRTLEGEMRLEVFLEGEGFLVVRPETLPVTEQIALINRHKWILSPVGSACHTRLFALEETNLVTITPAQFNPNYLLCDYLCEGGSHYINALVKPDIGTNVRLARFFEPVALDGDRLLGVLKQLGLVRASSQFGRSLFDLSEYKLRWIAIARHQAKRRPQEEPILLKAIEEVTASLETVR
jgi:hypothetical protein